jgi:hypothetical protein
MYSLKLGGEPKKFSLFGQSYPYSFTVDNALAIMSHIEVEVDNGKNTVTTMSCNIPRDRALQCIQSFMNARLLHCPRSRTLGKANSSTVLQLTAKGVHFYQRYCLTNGIKEKLSDELFRSEYATMQCVSLIRDPVTDFLVTSRMLLKVIFQRFLGEAPNVYDPRKPPELVPHCTLAPHLFDRYAMATVSPYYHCYFTNPHSDSLTQYFDSSSGVRVFDRVEFRDRGLVVMKHRVFTGKAMVQWLLECTDALYPHEALRLAGCFLDQGFIEPVTVKPSTATWHTVGTTRDDYYVASTTGLQISFWDQTIAEKTSSPDLHQEPWQNDGGNIDPKTHCPSHDALKMIISDPGYRLLFQEYLQANYCIENLMFYTETERLVYEISRFKSQRRDPNKKNKSILRSGSSILSSICAIYSRYIPPRAPFELNVDDATRLKISTVIERYGATESDGEAFKLIDELLPLLEQVKSLVLKMMEKDSLQKFLSSPAYVAITSR